MPVYHYSANDRYRNKRANCLKCHQVLGTAPRETRARCPHPRISRGRSLEPTGAPEQPTAAQDRPAGSATRQATTFTTRPGTTITRRGSLPARCSATASTARRWTSSSEASAGTSIRVRTLPLTCTG
jgi:hypothetical protein